MSMSTHTDMSLQANPYAVTLDQAPAFWQMDTRWVLLASGDQTAGRYCLLWARGPQGSGPGPHTHEQDEQVYVLDGELTVRVGTQLRETSAGSFLLIPRGTVHSYRVDSPTATLPPDLVYPGRVRAPTPAVGGAGHHPPAAAAGAAARRDRPAARFEEPRAGGGACGR